MQSRATVIYLLMLTLFGAGLWAILSAGSILLRAPEDLGGQWEIYATDSTADDEPLMEMSIEQSGKFIKLTLQDRPLDLKLMRQTRSKEHHSGSIRLELEGSNSSASFEGPSGGDEFRLSLDGPIRGTWLARRTQRTYSRGAASPHSPHQPANAPTTLRTPPHVGL
jgi:hypothetical protein